MPSSGAMAAVANGKGTLYSPIRSFNDILTVPKSSLCRSRKSSTRVALFKSA